MAERKHFVRFLSPGTLFSETTTRPIDSWDVRKAAEMSREIEERHGARPYGFQFLTNLVADPIDDGEGGELSVEPKQVDISGNHFITGDILLFDDIPDVPDKSTLRSNMRCNDWPVLIENRNSYRFTCQFEEGDVVVDRHGEVTRRGDEPALVEYRKRMTEKWKAEREVEYKKYQTA